MCSDPKQLFFFRLIATRVTFSSKGCFNASVNAELGREAFTATSTASLYHWESNKTFLHLAFIYAWTSSTAHQILRILICPRSDCKNYNPLSTVLASTHQTATSNKPFTWAVTSVFKRHLSSSGFQLLAYNRWSAVSYTEMQLLIVFSVHAFTSGTWVI